MTFNQSVVWDYQYQQHQNVWRNVTQQIPMELAGKVVLELGCGNGKTAAGILQQEVKELVGIDFAKTAVKECQKRFDQKKNARFLEGNIVDLPFKKESFDAAVSYHTLGHLLEKDRLKAIKEIKRVLKKKGRVYFEDFGLGDLRETKGKTVEKNTVERGNGITYHYFTNNDLKKLFTGWKKIQLTRETSRLRLGKEIVKRVEWKGIFEKKEK